LAAQAARRDGDFEAAGRFLSAYQRLNGSSEALAQERALLKIQGGNLTGSDPYTAFCWGSSDHALTTLILEALIQGSLKAGDVTKAMAAVELWLSRSSTPAERAQGLAWRGDCYLRVTTYERALVDYREAVALDGENDGARLRLVKMLNHLDPRGALEHLEHLMRRRADDREVRFQYARCQRGIGQPEEAARVLDELLAENPEESKVLLERGRAALDLGQLGPAERWLRRAQALAPDQREQNLYLALCLRQEGKKEEAQHFQDRFAQLDAQMDEQIEAQVARMRKDQPARKPGSSP
jgi:Flp pilus assembly protein TadD